MRKLCIGLFMIPLAALIGCSGSGTPGGPGASHRITARDSNGTLGETGTHTPATGSHTSHFGKEEGTFTLSVPRGLTAMHIKQGESKQIKIGVDKGKNFQEDVGLKFENLPKGVTAEPAAPVIRSSDKEANLTLKAAPDAAVGDFEVMVIGHPTKGADAENKFKLSVDKK